MYIRGIDRLGLPMIRMSDGPLGVGTWGRSVAYPAAILTAASWDTVLAGRLGHSLGKDAKAKGVHILLAPGVNMYRAPMCGRNFEYFGEDPYLASRMAVNYIKGVQDENVVATVKHFAGNNQEWDRNNVSSDIDERTLREIYLPAFRSSVEEANVGCVMNSYNLVNGVHATQNGHLNLDILKKDWGFKGILMSDWESTYEGVAAANNGLDLEMPSGKFMNKDVLLRAVKDGIVSEETINDKVRRILKIIFSFGFYDHPQTGSGMDSSGISLVALDAARGGIVLLKNEGGVLPFDDRKIKSIAVVGPNATRRVFGGGSSQVTPYRAVSALAGIVKLAAENGIRVQFASSLLTYPEYVDSTFIYTGDTIGVRTEYYNNRELKGEPVVVRGEKKLKRAWWNDGRPNIAGIDGDAYSLRLTGELRPEHSASYRIRIFINQRFRLWIGDQLVLKDSLSVYPVFRDTIISLQKGKSYPLRLEYIHDKDFAYMAVACYPVVPDFSDVIEQARKADATVVCVGYNDDLESEGFDRTFSLPEYQDSLIKSIAAVNPRTIVVINAGGNVNMQPWLSSVKGLLQAWYPGQEGGTALAEILFGKINPSGKLPVTFEKNWSENPTFNYYHDRDADSRVQYSEGLFVGYRGYEKHKIEPQFPFGYGLSYTTFAYSNLRIKKISPAPGGPSKVLVSFDIKNTGNCDGAEVIQLYVHQRNCPVERPFKELKGFSKVFLKKGATTRVTIELDSSAFSYYKTKEGRFGWDKGTFDVLIGSSSNTIRLKSEIQLTE